MLKILILIATAGLLTLIWQVNRAKRKKIAGGHDAATPTESATSDGAPTEPEFVGQRAAETTDEQQLFAPPTKLSPLEVPMIQARFEKLELWQNLSEYQSDRLRQMILEHCQEGRVAHWWSPLVGFSKYLDYQKGELPAIIIDATRLGALQVRRNIFSLDYHMRRSGIHLEDIQSGEGGEIEPDQKLTDGSIKVVYKFRDRAFRFPVAITDGQLDVPGMVRTLNGLLERRRASNRFVVLPPHGQIWCVIHSSLSTATQADRSRWGQMLLPAAHREEDVERVSEDIHSVVETEEKAVEADNEDKQDKAVEADNGDEQDKADEAYLLDDDEDDADPEPRD